MKSIENLKKVFPNKFWIIIFLILALVHPINYIVLERFPPNGYKFIAIGVDDATMLSGIKAYLWNYQDPWLDETDNYTYFEVPGLPFIFVPLGIIAHSLSIDALLFFIILKAIFGFTFLLVCYHLISFLASNNTKKYSLFFFYFSMGLSAIFYLFTISKFKFLQAHYLEIFEGSGINVFATIGRIYHVVPLTLGFLALLLYLRLSKKKLIIGVLQGLTMFLYPLFAIALLFIHVCYFLLNMSIERLKIIVIEIIFMIIGFLPWLYSYFQRPVFFDSYKYSNGDGVIFLPFFILAVFPLFLIYMKKFGNKKILILYLFTSLLLSLSQLVKFFNESPRIEINTIFSNNWISDILFNYQLLFYIPLFAVIVGHIFYLYLKKPKVNGKLLFVSIWFLAITMAFILPHKFGHYPSVKLLFFVWLPLSIMGGYAITLYRKNTKLIILSVIMIFSIIGIATFNYNMQTIPREDGFQRPTFVSDDEYSALMYLKNISNPNAKVMSSYVIGIYIPYTTEKRSLIGSGKIVLLNYEEKVQDYTVFFSSNATSEERCKIIKKYNLTFVFDGVVEKNQYNDPLKTDVARIKEIHAPCMKTVFNITYAEHPKKNIFIYEAD